MRLRGALLTALGLVSVKRIEMKSDASKTSHVMTLREVSAYLRVHPSTIYRMLKHHQIPAFLVGSDWRFNVEAIDHWRLQQEKPGG